MSAEIFVRPIRIEPTDIDELGHVNNIVYLRWAQEIAIAHWSSRAAPEMLTQFVWVVARHEVDYRAPLLLGDEAEVCTHVASEPKGATWARFVEIGKPGAQPSAKIVSNWVLLDAATRRVKRVPMEIVQKFLT